MLSPVDDGEYAAIKTIHRQLDDNADGSVDLSESAEVSTSASAVPSNKRHLAFMYQ